MKLSLKNTSRLAGIFYLIAGIPAVYALQYLPTALNYYGDPAIAASKVLASEFMFRFGTIAEMLNVLGFTLVALLLYKLFKSVNKGWAVTMVLLFVFSVPISFLNVVNSFAALILFHGGNLFSAFNQTQLNQLGLMFINLHDYGVELSTVFWGLWLFPYGMLMYKSGWYPKIVGILLVIAGLAYVATSSSYFLWPNYSGVVAHYATFLYFGELVGAIFLIIGPRGKDFEALEKSVS